MHPSFKRRSTLNESENFDRFAFIFCRLLTFFRYIGVYHTFGFLNCVRFNEDFVILRFIISKFCSIHFTVTLAGLKKIVRYTKDFVI